MLTERDEKLIQRCVDGELSKDERRELLERVENIPDGWKMLACSFMEDQLFAGAIGDTSNSLRQPTLLSKPAAPATSKRSWFYHPTTTLGLSLCVAFLAGMLVFGEFQQPAKTNVANSTPNGLKSIADTQPNGTNTTPSTLVSDSPDYSVRFEADGVSPRELPVYDDPAAFLSRFMEHQQQNAFEQGRNTTERSSIMFRR